MINPVYKREVTVSSRSIRLALIIGVFNMVLAVFAILLMEIVVENARTDAQIAYSSFLTIFKYVAIIEFALVTVIMPAITAGSISGERERMTLDLMLTTKITPAGIVFGKLEAALSAVFILIISSIPILALVFAYGGVTILNLLLLMVTFFVAAFFSATVGIWASASFRKSTGATTVAYIILAILLAGTAAIVALRYNLSGSTGRLFNILLINPAATFYVGVNEITGSRALINELLTVLGADIMGLNPARWFLLGTAIQIIMGFILIVFAIRKVKPGKK